jgi:hypothetical protein
MRGNSRELTAAPVLMASFGCWMPRRGTTNPEMKKNSLEAAPQSAAASFGQM